MQKVISQLALAMICFVGGPFAASADDELPLILKEDFESGFSRWQTTDPKGGGAGVEDHGSWLRRETTPCA